MGSKGCGATKVRLPCFSESDSHATHSFTAVTSQLGADRAHSHIHTKQKPAHGVIILHLALVVFADSRRVLSGENVPCSKSCLEDTVLEGSWVVKSRVLSTLHEVLSRYDESYPTYNPTYNYREPSSSPKP